MSKRNWYVEVTVDDDIEVAHAAGPVSENVAKRLASEWHGKGDGHFEAKAYRLENPDEVSDAIREWEEG